MALEPINYSAMQAQPDLIGSLAKGYQLGQSIRQDQQAQEDRQAADEQAKQYGEDVKTAMDIGTPKAFAALALKYPQQKDAITAAMGTLSKEQQEQQIGDASQVYSALLRGRTDIAGKLIDNHIQAMQNSGEDTRQLESLRRLIDSDPKTAANSLAITLSSYLGGDKFAANYGEINPAATQKGMAEATIKSYEAEAAPDATTLANEKTATEIKNIQSQISDRTSRLGLDADKLAIDIRDKLSKLSGGPALEKDARDLINASVGSSVAADQSASQMNDLASKLDASASGYGAAGGVAEWTAGITGNQDYISGLRSEYNRLRSQQVVKNLPPGNASDKDIEIAMKGFPPDTADSKYMASFLRGMAKLNQVSAATDSAKAEWVSQNGHLGNARTDLNIGGVSVPRGTTFADFSKKYIEQMATTRNNEQQKGAVSTRSYMKYADGQ